MIDGIKIMNLKTRNSLLKNKLLPFVGHHYADTYEVLPYNQKSKYKNLEFIFSPKYNNFRLDGSIHSYFNNGEHNYNDFSIENIRQTLNDLEDKFTIEGFTQLNNVEFGINIKLDYPPEIFIKSVINHKGENFYPMDRKYVKNGIGIECKHDQYYIKIYDKGTQYELSEFVLRIEIKVVRMKYFIDNDIPLKTWNDLKNKSLYPLLKKQFVNMLEDLLFCDIEKAQTVKMKLKEKLILAEGRNPDYWQILKPTPKDKKQDRKQAEKKRKHYYLVLKKFKTIVSLYKLDNKKNDVIKKSNKKWNELYNTKSNNFNGKTDKFTENNGTKSGQIHTIYKVGICTQPEEGKKYCLETGVDISDQKPYSKFVSANKVGEVIAKRIRNKFNDRKKRVNYLYNKYDDELTLFDMKEDGILKISNKEKGMIA